MLQLDVAVNYWLYELAPVLMLVPTVHHYPVSELKLASSPYHSGWCDSCDFSTRCFTLLSAHFSCQGGSRWQYVVHCDVPRLCVSSRGRSIEDLDGKSHLEQMPSKYGCVLGGVGRSEWWELDKEGINCTKVVWEEWGSGCKDARCLTIMRQNLH